MRFLLIPFSTNASKNQKSYQSTLTTDHVDVTVLHIKRKLLQIHPTVYCGAHSVRKDDLALWVDRDEGVFAFQAHDLGFPFVAQDYVGHPYGLPEVFFSLDVHTIGGNFGKSQARICVAVVDQHVCSELLNKKNVFFSRSL